MDKEVRETSVFPLEMFANSEIKPMLNVPSGYLRTGGYVCTDGRGLFRLSISEHYGKPMTYPDEPREEVKEVLLMVIPNPQRAEAMAETLMTLAMDMRRWAAKRGGRATQDAVTAVDPDADGSGQA